jgi:hypothetical protein
MVRDQHRRRQSAPPTVSALDNSALHAIQMAMAMASKLPDSEQVREIREQCLACSAIAEQWELVPPTPEERDDLMKRVVALQVSVTRATRSSRPPPPPLDPASEA